MEAQPTNPAQHWLTRHKRVGNESVLYPQPIEEEVEATLADLEADPGYGDGFDESNSAVKLSEVRAAAIAALLEEHAARIRYQVDTGDLGPAGHRLADLTDILVRDLRVASSRAGQP